MSDSWFQKLFINEAKPALKRYEGGGGKEPVLEEKEITENGVYAPSEGVDGFSKVDVEVPIPDGYIVPSGTKTINQNGTHDVTQYSKTTVNVPIPDGYIVPEGSTTFTSNGVYDVTEYAQVVVGVPTHTGDSSGVPISVSTESEMESILANATEGDNGKVYQYLGEDGAYKQGAYYILEV